MSITEETKKKMNAWQAEFDFNNSPVEEIFDFLNKRENLCTPGFLLRRQIQSKFPKLVETAAKNAEVKTYADLTETGNKAWDDRLIQALAILLREKTFDKCKQESLGVEVRQWVSYLSDNSVCQRETALKLIFALQMDPVTATKFLLANGNDLLSLRNPFDYACKTCSDCGLTYEDAEDLFNNFLEQRKTDTSPCVQTGSNSEFTSLIKSETKSFAKNNIINSEEVKQQILKVMLKYRNDFRDSKDEPGYSLQNLKKFKVFLKYMVLLYPTAYLFNGKNNNGNVKIATKGDGTPKVPSHLIASILDAHDIELPEYSELVDYKGPKLEARGSAHRQYDKIPFNKNFLIPLRSLSKNLRAILRAVKYPANSQPVRRDTVLLLTYFFITGWKFADEETRDKIQETLDVDLKNFDSDSPEEKFAFALRELVETIEYSEAAPVKTYIAALNMMLLAFEFTEFYAPFVLDRFILICLLAIEATQDQDFMSFVIDESYRLSKELMEGKRAEEDVRI